MLRLVRLVQLVRLLCLVWLAQLVRLVQLMRLAQPMRLLRMKSARLLCRHAVWVRRLPFMAEKCRGRRLWHSFSASFLSVREPGVGKVGKVPDERTSLPAERSPFLSQRTFPLP